MRGSVVLINSRGGASVPFLCSVWRYLRCTGFYACVACFCMPGTLPGLFWLFLWRCAACFGVACYGVFAAFFASMVFCIPAELPHALCRQNRLVWRFMALCVYIYVYRRFVLPMAFFRAYGVRWHPAHCQCLARFPFCPYSCRNH